MIKSWQNDPQIIQECQKSISPSSAYDLYELMSKISEYTTCSGWLVGIEKYLWNTISNTKAEINFDRVDWLQLAYLAILCNGWWIWESSNSSPKFISLSEARQYFQNQ